MSFIVTMILAASSSTPNLEQIEEYVTILSEDQYQELDEVRAHEDGIDPETIELAREIVEYQNMLVDKSYEGFEDLEVDAKDFPRLRTYQSKAYISNSFHPCGTYAWPIPGSTPYRESGYFDNPVAVLLYLGFHRTAGYACMESSYECAKDFTRGRGYYTGLGSCRKPIFRDQGYADARNGYVSIQYGEPNPEIHTYVWPYWNWAMYVSWWHERF